MGDFQSEKAVVLGLYQGLEASLAQETAAIWAKVVTPDWRFKGVHPFNELSRPEDVADQVWQPLKQALTALRRRQDIFIAGRNAIDGFQSVWVVSMGHLMGNFDAAWLGIAPTRKLTMLRYAEFHRVEGGKIAETAFFCDIPHVMYQAGLNPFPPQTGAHLVQPGPMTHGGLCFGPQNPAEGTATLAAIDYMVEDIKSWSGGKSESLEDELRRSWHDDMIWWGPAGIGASFTIERYAKQHSGPFRQAFQTRQFNGHIAKLAEGHFGGFFGWPNLTLTHQGGFMGMPATGRPGDMRVVDMYRRDGSKLAENWIFIDLLHFWNMQGLDILGRMATHPRT